MSNITNNIDKMTKSILILADPFGKPSFSPRLRSICEYLYTHGWNIDVYTERFEQLHFEHAYPIHEIDVYNHLEGKLADAEWVLKSIWSLFTDWRNRYFAKKICQEIKGRHYDLVFCTTFSTFPLYAALAASKLMNVPLHVDIRDIEEQVPGGQYRRHHSWWTTPVAAIYTSINIRRRNRVLKQAQQITTISPWHVEFLSQLNKNVHLIYNGYDENIFFPHDEPVDTFDIVYTGRIYSEIMQDHALLFEALTMLPDNMQMRLCFYVNDEGRAKMQALAKAYKVEHLMVYHDYVANHEVPDILHKSSILLVFNNKDTKNGPHGIMTTKFYEAMGVEKPLICVRSDEECMAQVMEETNVGIAATSPEQIRDFIVEKYEEWQTNGFTHQQVRDTKRFSRQRQAAQMEHLLQLLKSNNMCQLTRRSL